MSTDDSRLTITSPDRIRALAHPLRLELLEFLEDVGQATATECAAHTGETVANCSFHLRTLARAGLIEPAEQRGREKPWRPTATRRSFDANWDDETSVHAIRELAGLTVLREAERFRRFLSTYHSRPAGWEDTVALSTSRFWATGEEMAELVRAVTELTDRFAGRNDDPSLRPEGARPGRLVAMVNPDSFPGDEGDEQP